MTGPHQGGLVPLAYSEAYGLLLPDGTLVLTPAGLRVAARLMRAGIAEERARHGGGSLPLTSAWVVGLVDRAERIGAGQTGDALAVVPATSGPFVGIGMPRPRSTHESTTRAASRLGISDSRIRELARADRIQGALRSEDGRAWLIPTDWHNPAADRG